MKRFLLITLLAACRLLPTSAADAEMPIIAFNGVPSWQTADAHFLTFSECGFNVSLAPYPSLDQLVKACRSAERNGVRVLGRCPEMVSNPTLAARTLKQERGFYGYYMQDEPSVAEIHERQKEIERLATTDMTHVFYINLFPCYREDWIQSATKAKTYTEYLRAALATSCQQLSFDFYPVTTGGLRPTWYHNLEMVRSESLAAGKPFWGFVLSVPHDVPFTPATYYPTPTLPALRLQVYANLAYGAQAIQYFTYWTPAPGRFNYHDAPVDMNGRKTATYATVQQMNRELRPVARLFYGSRVLTVGHLGDIPQGTTRQTEMPLNIRSLRISGRRGAIVSQLEKDGHRYLAVVNKDHERRMTVRIRTQNDTPRHLTKTLQEEPMKQSYTVAAGDILLFRLN